MAPTQTTTPGPETPAGAALESTESRPPVEGQISNLQWLLRDLDECPRPLVGPRSGHQNQLAQVRLGIASSLFTALRIRHAPTSEHCLRVALGCSAWACFLELSEDVRDQIEVAALLHDIGKVGVPDSILRSPRPLTATEAEIMQQTRNFGGHILTACCAGPTIPQIVDHIPAWFNGGRPGFELRGADIPLGARVIAIVDAFDSMTTDHVYRKAMSNDRAIAELCENAGTQFDPTLVAQFAELQTHNRLTQNQQLTRRWLHELQTQDTNRFWGGHVSDTAGAIVSPTESRFHEKLFESMHDGVIFVDRDSCVVRWNRGAERLTGLAGKAVMQREWSPELVGLRDAEGRQVEIEDCPVHYAIASGTQSMHRMFIKDRRVERLPIDLHVVPVVSTAGKTCGATVLMRDATFETNLEQRVQTLHEKATRDPLTGVANRSEFDRELQAAVVEHLESAAPCSLIICDIDHFKSINDTFGHQAGDEALVSFASLLQRMGRREDLVARYGGEEFVIVCRDCSCVAAVELAESIRAELGKTPLSELQGRCITASFGVTELQPGDTSESILRRADRALLQAKDTGRNRVIQLGAGMDKDESTPKMEGGWWSNWLRAAATGEQVDCYLVTYVPINITVQKLRGFVADHGAEIVSLTEQQLVLRVQSRDVGADRRRSDRPVSLLVTLDFLADEPPAAVQRDSAEHTGPKKAALQASQASTAPGRPRTIIAAQIRSARRRDRRGQSDATRSMINSLRAYLMAEVYRTLEEVQQSPTAAE